MRIPGFGDRTTKTETRTVETGRVGDMRADGTIIQPGDDRATIRPGESLRAGETVRSTTVPDTRAAPGVAHGVVGGITAQELQKETHNAYERGRREERAARKNNPILAILVVLLAILGLALAVLAAMNGSFREGGEAFDRFLGQAGGEAREAGLEAQDAAGEAAQDAGAALQQRGEEAERAAETTPR